ncbi:hypothetical protein BU26DRAFT_513343 [Trematosphaeria pertusa]|uniref:Uncharacterized protein n=1 Tax=Trematosphaeria pertusa TaxID=390896 RepID=A0A6A6J1D9_9PLEO|nr:uncharacterized protein BU26DRAFT_513343 [Trematosphaeria pertusa]KAF2256529.1 hypothetical protein BU26DRAFT_513343 [Trematosphaeria pertusa]
MPLFGGSKETTTSPPPTTTTSTSPPARHRSLFNRRRSSSPVTTTTATSPKRHSGFLHKSGSEDASIIAARERVMSAEAAERDADRALFAARAAVREARDHVKRLEREAAEEARLAKIKQNQAKAIGKRGKMLGRYDHA